MDLERLLNPDGPWMHRLTTSESALCDLASSLERPGPPRVVARLIRGTKARTTPALFDEVAAALQFPFYFGENWDAFDECIHDLDWLAADVVLLVIADADALLDQEPSEDLRVLLKILEDAAQEPVRGEGWLSKPPQRLRVLLHSTAKEQATLSRRLHAIGIL